MGCLCAIYYCVCCDDFFFCRYNTMWVLLIYNMYVLSNDSCLDFECEWHGVS